MAPGEREGGSGDFLPPDAGGLEPDLGGGAPTPPAAPQPQAQGGWQAPQQAQSYPTPQEQLGWSPPPPPGWQPQPPPPQQPWAYQPRPATPDNGVAVAGFTLSVVAATLLLFSAGVSSIVSVVCAGLGIFYSLKGASGSIAGRLPSTAAWPRPASSPAS